MILHVRTSSGSKNLERTRLGLNVDREVLPLSRTASIALIEVYSPLVTINSDELGPQIIGIVDAFLLRRAQMLQ